MGNQKPYSMQSTSYIEESSKHFLEGTEEEYDKFFINVVYL